MLIVKSSTHSIVYWKLIFIASIISIILTSEISILIATVLIILFTMYQFLQDDFLILISIVSFTSLTSEISPTLRFVVQILNFVTLTFLFLKYYGLTFSSYPSFPQNLTLFISLFVLQLLISTIYSNYSQIGFEKIGLVLAFFTLVYLYLSTIRNDSGLIIILMALLISALFSLFALFIEGIKFQFNLLKLYQEIFSSTSYIGKNNVGVIFSFVLIFLISFLHTKLLKLKFLFYVIGILIFLGLLITNSRASIVCLFIGISFTLFILNRQLLLKSILGIGIIIAIIFFTPLWDEMLLYLRLDDIGTGREYLINATFEIIKRNFIFGVGPAATRHELYSNLPYLLNTPAEWIISNVYKLGDINQTHNFYLFLFSDLGLGGLILSLALPVFYFRNCYKVFSNRKMMNDFHYHIIVALIGSGAFIFSRALVEQMNILSYGFIYYDIPFWLLMVINCYLYKIYKPNCPSE